jgi:hypothetical protein
VAEKPWEHMERKAHGIAEFGERREHMKGENLNAIDYDQEHPTTYGTT